MERIAGFYSPEAIARARERGQVILESGNPKAAFFVHFALYALRAAFFFGAASVQTGAGKSCNFGVLSLYRVGNFFNISRTQFFLISG